VFEDDPDIAETDLSSDDADMDDADMDDEGQDPPGEETLSSGESADEPQPPAEPPPAEGMEKFKKLYRVLTMLEQKVTINFPRDSNEISTEALEVLSEISDVLIYYPGISINVIGYTDSTGVYNYNKSLSRFRANIVKSYLVGRGVKPAQITASGMGPQDPIAENKTLSGRKINRRVEIVLNEEG